MRKVASHQLPKALDKTVLNRSNVQNSFINQIVFSVSHLYIYICIYTKIQNQLGAFI